MWRKVLAHPAYDAFWKDQALDRILAAQPLKVPVLLVHSLFDQEDIYGAPAVYKAIEPKDAKNDMVYLVLGPWHHGQEIREGSALGAVKWDSDTALWFRRNVLGPFLDEHLKDGAPKSGIAPVTAFETGTNTWRRLNAWPAGCEAGCAPKPTPLYLGAGAESRLRRAEGGRGGVLGVRLRPRQARPVPRAARTPSRATRTTTRGARGS